MAGYFGRSEAFFQLSPLYLPRWSFSIVSLHCFPADSDSPEFVEAYVLPKVDPSSSVKSGYILSAQLFAVPLR